MLGNMGALTAPARLGFQKAVNGVLKPHRNPRLLSICLLAIAIIAFADWRIGPHLSLGGLYIFPMLLAATVLPTGAIVALAVVCALLRIGLDDSQILAQYAIRFSTAVLTYLLSGLFAAAVMRNREMAIHHLTELTHEQRLRNEVQERLEVFVDSSPAAIVTLDDTGRVIAANRAANMMFGMQASQTLEGRAIKPYMPVLAEVLRFGNRSAFFRTAAQAPGKRENGEIFLADLWFSTYSARDGLQLAAILVDSSEEMRDREQQNLRNLSTSSRLVAAAVLHEIRNICSAISVVYSNLRETPGPCGIDQLQSLGTLITGLGRVASLELNGSEPETLEAVPLRQVLDELRIIIEPAWRDIDGNVCLALDDPATRVLADRYSLMQVFLNLSQNGHRAVQARPERRLSIAATTMSSCARITFRDTGCGVTDPQHLFQPFQRNAKATGLGLFISRTLVRSFGGEMWFEPLADGSSFVVELPLAVAGNSHA